MGMVTEVFVVTAGEYDDKQMVGVYTSIKELQKLLPNLPDDMEGFWFGEATKPCDGSSSGEDRLHVQVMRQQTNPAAEWVTDYWGVPVEPHEIRSAGGC